MLLNGGWTRKNPFSIFGKKFFGQDNFYRSLVMLSPSPVTLSEAKGLDLWLRVNPAKDLVRGCVAEILRYRSE